MLQKSDAHPARHGTAQHCRAFTYSSEHPGLARLASCLTRAPSATWEKAVYTNDPTKSKALVLPRPWSQGMCPYNGAPPLCLNRTPEEGSAQMPLSCLLCPPSPEATNAWLRKGHTLDQKNMQGPVILRRRPLHCSCHSSGLPGVARSLLFAEPPPGSVGRGEHRVSGLGSGAWPPVVTSSSAGQAQARLSLLHQSQGSSFKKVEPTAQHPHWWRGLQALEPRYEDHTRQPTMEVRPG